MKHIAPLVAAFILACSLGQAFAGDPVYPPGARIGLTPLVGLAPAKSFSGFETADQDVKVIVSELPATAYGEVENAFTSGATSTGPQPETIETAAGKAYYTAENARDPAGKPVRRYSMILSGGAFSGYVAMQVPETATRIYSDDAVRQMFASAAVRKDVPVEEQLGLLPFRVTQMSDFKTVRTLAAGAAILLADGTDENAFEATPYMVLGTIGSAPEKADDRGRFAQQAASLIPGLRNARITMSEPVRIDGMPGYETRIEAVSGKDNTPVNVVQWLRFGGATMAMRIIGSTPRDSWSTAFPRFRAVRDGIKPL